MIDKDMESEMDYLECLRQQTGSSKWITGKVRRPIDCDNCEDRKPGLEYDFKFFTPVPLEAISAISQNYTPPTFHYIKDGICINCKTTMEIESIKKCPVPIWNKFKALHPNTPETPDYSEASVKRWLYHIKEAEKNQGFEKVERDTTKIEAIRKNKGVKKWEDFNAFQQISYYAIAECYPGVQVFACGSQVRGDYMEYPVFEYIKSARKKAGMRIDRVSDFDYWVHPDAKQSSVLPNYADRFRGKFNEKEMIPIPIYYGDV